MKEKLFMLVILISATIHLASADPSPVRGFCIGAPAPENLEQFLSFMENDLAPGGINTLVIMIHYNYEYESYPNLKNEEALTKKEVKQIVRTAEKHGIRLIPQINLLGHQSWAGSLNKLLEEYPEFDETPSVGMPEDYEWPNEDGLYCKSYCPLHPGVHKVIFAVVDEIMEVFEADAFHAGMDEVFYIGEDECPRCSGKDRSELFAGEVNRIRDHLAANEKELWIWGDRLLDGKTTGLGMWEASENDTHRAIDMIRKDVVICDWHYERAEPTAAYFALKGFRVITCPYNKPGVTKSQLEMMEDFRIHSNNELKNRFYGFMQTVWNPAGRFLDLHYGENEDAERMGPVESFREMVRFYRDAE